MGYKLQYTYDTPVCTLSKDNFLFLRGDIFCRWHINDDTGEIDRSSEPWDNETCWWVVDSQCDLCHNPYGMDSRYPISICTECGHIQEEYNR